nr:RecName: Full=Unknown protein 9 from 2D-PAGE [Fructilactobacillus sanfranciscensis]
LRLDLSNLR